jgi:hypothetical protein
MGTGVYVGARELYAAVETRAYASLVRPAPALSRDSLHPARSLGLIPLEGPGALPPIEANFWIFEGIRDDYLLSPLRAAPPRRVKFNRGGSSLSLRIDFEGGGRAAFKPDQTNFQSIPRKEVAAYRINRLLGLSSVAPAVARDFSQEQLVAAVDPEQRALIPRFLAEVVRNEQGRISGGLSFWIPVIEDATIEGFAIDHVEGIVRWKRYLAAGAPVPNEERLLLGQISTLVAFDYLINNPDRWSGSNAKASADGRSLYFMDNAMSFGSEPLGTEKTLTYLLRVQKFSRSLAISLRHLDVRDVRAAMTTDSGPYERLLTDEEIVAIMDRRDVLVAYMDDTVKKYGEDAVMVFP